MEPLKLSVVIPTCDRPAYLKAALGSVLNQTYPPYEVVVVDNGREQVRPADLPAFDRLRVIRALPRFGVAQARNVGAVLATGDYIAFLDDDDAWDPQYLENVCKTIETTGADVVLARLRDMATGQPMKGKQAEFSGAADLIQQIMRRNPGAGGSNTTVRRAAFAMTQGYNPWITTNQDKALVLDLLLAGCSVARAGAAWVDVRDDGQGPRQTDLSKRVQGKMRFLSVYWKRMGWRARLLNLAQIARLWAHRVRGAAR
jgi:glycosyltransferase involved in cell wall biosynthesis